MDSKRAAFVLDVAATFNGNGRATSDELKEAISLAVNILKSDAEGRLIVLPYNIGEEVECFGAADTEKKRKGKVIAISMLLSKTVRHLEAQVQNERGAVIPLEIKVSRNVLSEEEGREFLSRLKGGMNQPRPIDANGLMEEILKGLGAETDFRTLQEIIASRPTIYPEWHEKWINDDGYDDWHCSGCGHQVNCDDYPTEYEFYQYCGKCGARMDGE